MADREKLIELLNEASEILLETVGSFNDNHGNGMRADHLIANGVTVQKHGRWIGVDSSYWRWTPDGGHIIEKITFCCSECGRKSIIKTNYCPNCGARMDGERRTDD